MDHGIDARTGRNDRRAVTQVGHDWLCAGGHQIADCREGAPEDFHAVATCEQGAGHITAEKAGSAGDEDLHGSVDYSAAASRNIYSQ